MSRVQGAPPQAGITSVGHCTPTSDRVPADTRKAVSARLEFAGPLVVPQKGGLSAKHPAWFLPSLMNAPALTVVVPACVRVKNIPLGTILAKKPSHKVASLGQARDWDLPTTVAQTPPLHLVSL